MDQTSVLRRLPTDIPSRPGFGMGPPSDHEVALDKENNGEDTSETALSMGLYLNSESMDAST